MSRRFRRRPGVWPQGSRPDDGFSAPRNETPQADAFCGGRAQPGLSRLQVQRSGRWACKPGVYACICRGPSGLVQVPDTPADPPGGDAA